MFNPLSTKDSAIQIALLLKGADLWNLCSTNKQLLTWICINEQFWNQKIMQDFKINTYETLNRAGALEDYKFLYYIKDVDSNALDMFLLDESKAGNIDHVKLLLKNGVNINAHNDEALRWAAWNGHRDLVELLLKYGADVHAGDGYALRNAAVGGHRDLVELLLKYGADVHAYDDYALRWASRDGHKDVVELLLKYGADIHAWNNEALKWAIENCREKIIKLLLENGANPAAVLD